MKPAYRNNQLLFSDECLFYLKLEAKRMVNGTDANVTLDQLANGIVRNELTTHNPEWVIAWDEFEQAKQAAGKSYRDIEARALGGKDSISP